MTVSEPKPCWECFKKRRVCDFSRPACRKCVSRGVICPGYDQKPLKWLQPGQTRSKGRRARDEAGPVIVRRHGNVVPPSLPLIETQSFEAVVYYNSIVCPDLEAFGKAGEGSPYFVPLFALAYMNDAIRETVMCTSLGHRLLQFGYDMQCKDAMVYARRLQTHRGNVIRQISGMISEKTSDNMDLLLSSILIFLFSEISQSIAPTWSHHSDGAHAIIESQGGLRQVLLTKRNMTHILRYFLIADIFGATTTANLSLEKTNRQMSIIDLLKSLFGIGVATSVPCHHGLMRLIILINHQRALHTSERPSAAAAFGSMLNILDQIRAFRVEDWVSEMTDSHRHSIRAATPPDSPEEEWEPWNWDAVGRAYQTAVALYCISSLTDLEEIAKHSVSGAFHRVYEVMLLQESCRRSLLGILKELATKPSSQIRKLVFWPVFMAGIVSVDDEDGARTFVLGELQYISRSLGTAAALIGRQFLTKLWQSGAPANTDAFQAWDQMFDRPYVFAV